LQYKKLQSENDSDNQAKHYRYTDRKDMISFTLVRDPRPGGEQGNATLGQENSQCSFHIREPLRLMSTPHPPEREAGMNRADYEAASKRASLAQLKLIVEIALPVCSDQRIIKTFFWLTSTRPANAFDQMIWRHNQSQISSPLTSHHDRSICGGSIL